MTSLFESWSDRLGVPALESAAALSDRQAAPTLGIREIWRAEAMMCGPVAATVAGAPGRPAWSRTGPRPVRIDRARTAATLAPARREACEPRNERWWEAVGFIRHLAAGGRLRAGCCTDRAWRIDWTPSGRLFGTAANSCLLPTRTPRGQRDERRAGLRGAARRPRARGSRRPAKGGLGPRDSEPRDDWEPAEGLAPVCAFRAIAAHRSTARSAPRDGPARCGQGGCGIERGW